MKVGQWYSIYVIIPAFNRQNAVFKVIPESALKLDSDVIVVNKGITHIKQLSKQNLVM